MKTRIAVLSCLTALYSLTGMARADLVIQAEQGNFEGKLSSDHSGYTGSGFVDLTNASGSSISWDFSITEALPQALVVVRWANGKSDTRNMCVTVNDSVQLADYFFGSTGNWTVWKDDTLHLSLRKGRNVLSMRSLTSVGGPNLDKITILGATEAEPEVPSPSERSTAYYCAPQEKGGSDSNDGSLEHPFFHLEKALALMQPGDTVLMRGGIYRYTATIRLTAKGNAVNRLHIFNFPGEQPVLNFYDIFSSYTPTPSSRGSARAFLITGDYWYLKGLEICQAPDNGIKVEGSHNIFERLVLHHNGDSGIQIGLSSNAADAPDKVCDNLVKNCDSYRNFDWGTAYENADGFACKLSPGANNRFVGCRAWENADDGWDFYMTHYPIFIDSCWTFGNGDERLIVDDPDWEYGQKNVAPTSWQGDGNGFKLGGDGWAAKHQVRNCISFDGCATGGGFSENNNADSIFLFNCTAWHNVKNFRLRKYACDVRNCISFDPATQNSSSLYELFEGTVEMNNTWNSIDGEPAMIPTRNASGKYYDQKYVYDEFVSTSKEDFLAPRQADGSLPDNGFGRLKQGSMFIDKGTSKVKGVSQTTFSGYEIELPFNGLAVDLGAYEYGGPLGVPALGSDKNRFNNYPNPVLDHTRFSLTASCSGWACVDVYDLSGHRVASLVAEDLMTGERRVLDLDASLLPSGVYEAVLTEGGSRSVLKMIKR